MSDVKSDYSGRFTLEHARDVLCRNLEGRICEVPLSFFKDAALPSLQPAESELLESVDCLVENDRWLDFGIDPTESTPNENSYPLSLSGLFNKIIEKAAPALGHTLDEVKWVARTRPNPLSNEKNDLHAAYKPDASTIAWLYEVKLHDRPEDIIDVRGYPLHLSFQISSG